LYDGKLLGWVNNHHCCKPCSKALDRYKLKMEKSLEEKTEKEKQKDAMQKAMSSMPEWTLPPPSNDRLLAVGSQRDDAKRASRVLLQAVIENYADRTSSYQTPEKGKKENEDESESLSEDVETPIIVVPDEKEEEEEPPKTPARKFLEANTSHKKRLSMGIIAGLEDLSQIAKTMDKTYEQPKDADDQFVAQLAEEPKKEEEAKASFESEFQKELGIAEVTSEVGEEVYAAELGEEISADAELNKEIAALDTVISADVKSNVEKDPVQHIEEALTQVVNAPSNPDAQIAMHEDMIEVLQDVRREERDAKMLAMLDSVELRLKDSLVKAQTPVMKRKVPASFANNKYHLKQTVAAKNTVDGCWYTAQIVEFDTEEKRYMVRFMGGGRTQMCGEQEEVREFLVGNYVHALYKSDGLRLYQAGIVEYITPEGQYKVCFDSDKSHQLCTEAEVQKAEEKVKKKNEQTLLLNFFLY
jgi:hypothetical protein